jgi:hypothetical protein
MRRDRRVDAAHQGVGSQDFGLQGDVRNAMLDVHGVAGSGENGWPIIQVVDFQVGR